MNEDDIYVPFRDDDPNVPDGNDDNDIAGFSNILDDEDAGMAMSNANGADGGIGSLKRASNTTVGIESDDGVESVIELTDSDDDDGAAGSSVGRGVNVDWFEGPDGIIYLVGED